MGSSAERGRQLLRETLHDTHPGLMSLEAAGHPLLETKRGQATQRLPSGPPRPSSFPGHTRGKGRSFPPGAEARSERGGAWAESRRGGGRGGRSAGVAPRKSLRLSCFCMAAAVRLQLLLLPPSLALPALRGRDGGRP